MIMPAKTETSYPTVFVLEIDGQPILAFRAATSRQARELGKEDRLQEGLKRMMIGHRPLWDGKSPIRVRRGGGCGSTRRSLTVASASCRCWGSSPLAFRIS